MDTEKLMDQTERCRRLARAITDEKAIAALLEMAADCEAMLAQASDSGEDTRENAKVG